MHLKTYKSTEDVARGEGGTIITYPNNEVTFGSSSNFQKVTRKIWPTGFNSEAKSVIKIAFPVIVTNLSAFLIMTESIILCGHLNDKYIMDGAALGNSIINALGISIGTGMVTACDTFFSQLYGSISQKKRIGMVLQRSLMIVSFVPLIVWGVHINIEPFFVVIGQDLRVSELAAEYMLYFSPGMMFAYHFLVLTRYLQNQDKVYPPMVIGIIGNLFNVLSQYLAIYQWGFGMKASAICQALTYLVMLIMLLVYILVSKAYVDTWDGWKKEAFLDWSGFLGLAIPGICMVSMETFCWEIGTFLAGLMGPVQLGVQSILFQLETITFMMTFGVSVAVNIRVGQALGANNPKRAITAYRAGAAIMMMMIIPLACLFLALKDYLPGLFSTDKEIIHETSNIFFVMIGVQIIDSLATVTMGALRGCGRHKLGTVFIFCAYYVLGQPIGISLAFLTDLQVQGLWVGLLIALSISVTTVVTVVNLQNWQAQADKAQERIKLGMMEEEEKQEESESEAESIYSDGGNTFIRHNRRRPSQGRDMGYRSLKIPIQRQFVTDEEYSKIILQRFGVLFVFGLFFAGAIMLRLYLPRSAYWPDINNSTLTTEAYPFP